jgi:hypothetical protein
MGVKSEAVQLATALGIDRGILFWPKTEETVLKVGDTGGKV